MSHIDPSNDNATPSFRERRAEARRRVLLKGKIVYPHNSFSADCTIRDLSASGARIAAAPEAMTSDPFLIVVGEAVVHQSAFAWRKDQQASLRFQRSVNLDGGNPSSLTQRSTYLDGAHAAMSRRTEASRTFARWAA